MVACSLAKWAIITAFAKPAAWVYQIYMILPHAQIKAFSDEPDMSSKSNVILQWVGPFFRG